MSAFMELQIDPRALQMIGKQIPTELYSQTPFLDIFIDSIYGVSIVCQVVMRLEDTVVSLSYIRVHW